MYQIFRARNGNKQGIQKVKVNNKFDECRRKLTQTGNIVLEKTMFEDRTKGIGAG